MYIGGGERHWNQTFFATF